MLIETRGIVFRSLKYSENSLIVDIYTEAKGLQSYFVNGVRSQRSRQNASVYQVMTLVDLVAGVREDRGLNKIKEIKTAFIYNSLPFDVRKSAVGMFMAEVARKTIREAESHSELFAFLYNTFLFLDQTSYPVANLHLHFLVELSGFLGFMPGGDLSEESPVFDLQEGVFCDTSPSAGYCLDLELSKAFYALLQTNYADCHNLRIPASQRRQLLSKLLDYYRLHLEHLPEIHSHQILQEVLG
jgi:DNA repair protein RecO (recombination protein O)